MRAMPSKFPGCRELILARSETIIPTDADCPDPFGFFATHVAEFISSELSPAPPGATLKWRIWPEKAIFLTRKNLTPSRKLPNWGNKNTTADKKVAEAKEEVSVSRNKYPVSGKRAIAAEEEGPDIQTNDPLLAE